MASVSFSGRNEGSPSFPRRGVGGGVGGGGGGRGVEPLLLYQKNVLPLYFQVVCSQGFYFPVVIRSYHRIFLIGERGGGRYM